MENTTCWERGQDQPWERAPYPMVKQVPRVAFLGPGVDTCFPGVGELKSSSVMAPETTPCFRGPM